ncbi:MAG: HD family phosphohydrolase [Nitrospirota bacterium]
MEKSKDNKGKLHIFPRIKELTSKKVNRKKQRLRFYKNPLYQSAAMGVSFVILVTYLLTPDILFFFKDLKIGETVSRDITSPITIEIPDITINRKNQEKAESEVPPIYDFDLKMINRIEDRVSLAFEEIHKILKDNDKDKLGSVEYIEEEKIFQNTIKAIISPSSLKVLKESGYDKRIKREINKIIRLVMEIGVVADKELLYEHGKNGVILRIVGGKNEHFIKDVRSISGRKEANKLAKEMAHDIFPEEMEKISVVGEIVSKLITPNITFNKNETELRKREESLSMRPLYYKVKKGEVILKAGERVTDDKEIILQEISKYQKGSFLIQILSGLFILVASVLYVFYTDIRRYKPYYLKDIPKFLLLCILFSGTIIIAKFLHFLLWAFVDTFPSIDPNTIIFAIPVAAGAMLATLLFDIHIAIVFSFIISLLMGVMISEEPLFIFYSFVGSIVATFSVIHFKKRTDLLRAGCFVGAVNLLMVVSIDLYRVELFTLKGLFDVSFGLGGGIVVSLVVSTFLPLLESLFDIATDIKLLELLDLNRPILKRLLLSAPGTYHHSIMLSNIAESAAEAINANPILTRVGCYYHDIGKMNKPEYYIENQMGSFNRHDRLSPNISSLILISHIKDGIETAKMYKLPKVIIDLIPQHHGTRLIKYFYEKARANHDPDISSIKENDFRYPGPKPQTKEAAIIMLADAVEAASRNLSDPSASRISNLSNRLVNDIFIDGQLDESDLTLRDLKKITISFSKILTGIFHHRIEYPGVSLVDDNGAKDEYLHKEQSEKGQGKEQRFKKVGRKDSFNFRI